MDASLTPLLNSALVLLGERPVAANDPASRDRYAAFDAVIDDTLSSVSRDTALIRPLKWATLRDPISVEPTGGFTVHSTPPVFYAGTAPAEGPPGFNSLYLLPSFQSPVADNIYAVMDTLTQRQVPAWRLVHPGYLALPDGFYDAISVGTSPNLAATDFLVVTHPQRKLFVMALAMSLAQRLTSSADKLGAAASLHGQELRRLRYDYAKQQGTGHYGSNPFDKNQPADYDSWQASR